MVDTEDNKILSIAERRLKEVIESAISDIEGKRCQCTCSSDEYKEQHEFLKELLESERAKKEMMNTIKTQILGWGIMGIMGIIGTWVASHLSIWK